MTNPAIQTLETAAQIFLAPPNLVTPEQRREAEAIILDFRKLKSPYQLCKEILENSSSEYVIFEAVGLLKSALIKEWADLNDTDILSLRHYFMQYIVERQIPPFVREKIIQLMAIMVKRLSLEDVGQERRRYIEEAHALISQGPHAGHGAPALLGCGLLQALLQEHSITVRSADTGLPWVQHFKLKKQFEALELKTIFTFIMKVLEQLNPNGTGVGHGALALAEKLLLVAEGALCWGHVSPLLPRCLVGVFEAMHESDSPPALRRSAAWRPLLTDEKLPVIFASMASQGGPLLRPALSCLGQLASLSGAALPDDMRSEHALRIARALFPLLSQAPGAASAPAAALRLLVLHNTKELLAWPPGDVEHLLHTVAQYTLRLIHLSAYEESNSADMEGGNAMTSKDGLEAALEAWVALLHAATPPAAGDSHAPPPQPLLHVSSLLFQEMLRVRLAPPDGTRPSGAEDEAEVEEEGSDLEKYDSILQLVGALGRASPADTLPLLCTILEARTERLHELLRLGEEGPAICNIYEDLHWTLIFAGHVLTMEGDGDGEGETPTPPGELLRYTAQVGGDPQASVRLLEATNGTTDPADRQAAHQIVRLVSAVWQLCWTCGWGAGRWLGSPTLAAGCAWLLRRWARAYALSPLLPMLPARQLGARLAAGAAALLTALPGEPDVAKRAVALLVTVASNKHKETDIVGCVELWEAVQWGLGAGGSALGPDARRGLARAGALATAHLPSAGPERATRLASLLQPAREALNAPTESPALAHALDVYAGLADGVQSGTAECIWESVRPALEVCAALAGSSAARAGGGVVAALRAAAACALRLPALLASSPHCPGLLAALAAPLDNHAALPQPPLGPAGDTSAEDEFCEEMSLVMEIGSGLVGAGWLQEGTAEATGREAAVRAARATLPRLAPPSPLLRRPTLAHQFYRLLQDLGARTICSLEDEYFNAAMSSIAEGMESGPAGAGAGPVCELLAELAALSTELAGQDPRLLHALEPLTARLLTLSVSGAMQDVPRPVSSALYALLTALPHLRAQLPACLTQHHFNGQRQDSLRFRDNFEKFIADMQSST